MRSRLERIGPLDVFLLFCSLHSCRNFLSLVSTSVCLIFTFWCTYVCMCSMAHHSDDGKKRPRKSEADRPTKKARTQTVVDILAKDEKKVLPYFGEGKCSVKTAKGAPCGKIAYYALRGQTAVCGRHKGKEKGEWRTLRKNPNAETERADAYAAHMETVLAAQAENKAAGKRGTVTCIQLPFRRRPPPPIPGVEDIRPNYADANVKGARGLARLSPKSMGPVGEVLNLENFHQSTCSLCAPLLPFIDACDCMFVKQAIRFVHRFVPVVAI